MLREPGGPKLEIDETKLLPIKTYTVVVASSGMFVVPENVDRTINGIMDTAPQGIMPETQCTQCGRKDCVILLRRGNGVKQRLFCLNCGAEIAKP